MHAINTFWQKLHKLLSNNYVPKRIFEMHIWNTLDATLDLTISHSFAGLQSVTNFGSHASACHKSRRKWPHKSDQIGPHKSAGATAEITMNESMSRSSQELTWPQTIEV